MDFLKYFDEAQQFQNSGERLTKRLRQVEQRYELKELIGEGGMKRVHRAFDKQTGRDVAMALLKGPSPDEAVEAFLREAQICSWLQHPGIVPVYDVGLNELGKPYFCMKLIESGNLSQLLEQQPKLSGQRRLELFIRICEALEYAHSRGVVHLDLKPDNVFCSEFGEVLIGDWGLAQIRATDIEVESSLLDLDALDFAEANFLTLNGELKGTPGFMAPEQMKKAPGQSKDELCDVYALGALLFNILAAEAPFKGKGIDEIISRVLAGELPEISAQVAAPMRAVIHKAMAADVGQRYQSVAEIRTDIRAWLDGFAPQAQKATLFQQWCLLYRRQRLFFNTLFSALLLLLVVTSVYLKNLREKNVQLQQSYSSLEVEQKQTSAALEELQKEQLVRQEAERRLAPKYSEQALNEYKYNFDFDSMRRNTARALKYDPDNWLALGFRGHLFMLERDFRAAAEAYQLAELKQHYRLALKYAAAPGGKANDQQLQLCIDDHLKLGHELIAKFLLQHLIMEKGNFEDQIELVKFYLPKFNPGRHSWDIKFSNERNENSVDLSGQAQLNDISLLKYVKLQHLDLSSSGLSDISVLNELPLKSLDLSASRVTSLSGLSFPQLKRLDISRTNINSLKEVSLPRLQSIDISDSLINSRQLQRFKTLKTLKK